MMTFRAALSFRHSLKALYLNTGCFQAVSTEASPSVADGVKPFSQVPSPKGAVPLLGHSLLLKKMMKTSTMSEYVMKTSQELGPIFKLSLIGRDVLIFLTDPAAVEKIFRNEGKYPVRLGKADALFQWFFASRNERTPFAFETGEKWRDGRSKLGKQQMPANVFGYCPGFSKVSNRFVRNIFETQDKEGYIEDVRKLVVYWSLEVGAQFVLGADIDFRNDEHQHAAKIKKAFEDFVSAIAIFFTAAPLYKIFPTPTYRRLSRAFDLFNEVGDFYANQHMARIRESARTQQTVNGMSLLEQWLIEGKLTEEEAVSSGLEMMRAGVDGTGNAAAFLLYELSKHRDVQDKLHDQIVSVLGNEKEADGHSLQKIPYLGHIIKETQRLYPVAPGVPRVLANDMEILGYHIPAGTTVGSSHRSIAQNPKYFKDPKKYNPDRWAEKDIHPFALLPFGFGPRSCWGRRFAEVEMKVLLTTICRQFIMEAADSIDTQIPIKEMSFLRPNAPIKIKFIPR